MPVTSWLSQESGSEMEILRSMLGINPFGEGGDRKRSG